MEDACLNDYCWIAQSPDVKKYLEEEKGKYHYCSVHQQVYSVAKCPMCVKDEANGISLIKNRS